MVTINITKNHLAYFIGVVLIFTSFLIAIAAVPGVSHSWDEITGAPATATRWPAWSEVTSKPATATRDPTWAEVTSKPAGFSDGVDNTGVLSCISRAVPPLMNTEGNVICSTNSEVCVIVRREWLNQADDAVSCNEGINAITGSYYSECCKVS